MKQILRVLARFWLPLTFSISVIAFAKIYHCLYAESVSKISNVEGRNLFNYEVKEMAFLFSDTFNKRAQIKALNDLRIVPVYNEVIRPESWLGFGYLSRASGMDKDTKLDQLHRRGISAVQLVEQVFPRHEDIYYRFHKFSDTGEDSALFFVKQMNELAPRLVRKNVMEAGLAAHLVDELGKKVTLERSGNLAHISQTIINIVEKFTPDLRNRDELKDEVYVWFLGCFGYTVVLNIDQVHEKLDYWDFLYYSVIAGSTTGFGDITPISRAARIWTGIQVFLSYFMLAALASGRFMKKTS